LPSVILSVALLLCGCEATIFYTQLSPPPRPLVPHPVEKVETFAVTPPARPHTNIGLFQIVEGVEPLDSAAMIAQLRTRAAQMGCDAILVTAIDHIRTQHHPSNAQASCLVYDDPPTASRGGAPDGGAAAAREGGAT
jgi:hypothetical protein